MWASSARAVTSATSKSSSRADRVDSKMRYVCVYTCLLTLTPVCCVLIILVCVLHHSQDRLELIVRVLAASVVYVLMGTAIAFLRHDVLRKTVSALLVLQQVVVLSSYVSALVSDGALGAVFNALALSNFEVTYFKPGCSLPSISFVETFAVMLILTGLASLLFECGALARAHLHRRTGQAAKFWIRTVHAQVVLATVVYLQIALRAMEGVTCVTSPSDGELYLKVEMSTRCYSGTHLPASAGIWGLIVVYLVGFPLWCLYIGKQHFSPGKHLQGEAHLIAMEQYAFLFVDVKPEFYWYVCV
jgi:hypothetical protein